MIVLSRVAVILLTPGSANLPDLRIYQAAGQAVLAEINPYDFQDQEPRREALRAQSANPAAGTDDFAATLSSWNYYVSGNLPASSALYALFESLADGSRFTWRLLLILGDVAIFLGLCALLLSVRGGISHPSDQFGVACLTVINPILIVSGCAIPEEKQFQTALMLFAAALLSSRQTFGTWRGLSLGAILGVSVLFKFFGVFLLPLWLQRTLRESARFALATIIGGALTLIASLLYFGVNFITTMSRRGVENSFAGPEHASPWVLAPWLSGDIYLLCKTTAVLLFCGAMVLLTMRRRIDLLNCCAGFAVAFACLWLDKGAMNRMNIVIVFAVAALVSISRKVFVRFSGAIVVVGGCAYAIGFGLLRYELTSVDAVLVLAFVSTYMVVVAGLKSATGSSPTAATAESSA